jgi:hypothetical protein
LTLSAGEDSDEALLKYLLALHRRTVHRQQETAKKIKQERLRHEQNISKAGLGSYRTSWKAALAMLLKQPGEFAKRTWHVVAEEWRGDEATFTEAVQRFWPEVADFFARFDVEFRMLGLLRDFSTKLGGKRLPIRAIMRQLRKDRELRSKFMLFTSDLNTRAELPRHFECPS